MPRKLLAALALAAFGLPAGVSGEEGATDWSSPPPSTPVYTPPPAYTSPPPASAPTASGAKSAPRTGLYGTVMQGNGAADNTVDDYTRRPTLIGDLQYIAGYGGADMANAAFSFQGGSFNWFGSILARPGATDPDGVGPAPAQSNPDDVRFGLANRTFGAGLLLAVSSASTDVPGGTNAQATLEASGGGLFGDFNLGGSDIYGELALRTGFGALDGLDHNVRIEAPGTTLEDKNLFFQALAGWKKDATTEGTHSLNAELALGVSSKEDQLPAEESQALSVQLSFAHGYILKQAEGFGVFLGYNAALLYASLNPEGGTDESGILLALLPNVSFQKTLGKGFEAFAGASVGLFVASESMDPPAGDDLSSFVLLSDGANVSVGLRWVYENFAFEGHLNESLLFNGPFFVGGTASPMFGGTGGAIGLSVGF